MLILQEPILILVHLAARTHAADAIIISAISTLSDSLVMCALPRKKGRKCYYEGETSKGIHYYHARHWLRVVRVFDADAYRPNPRKISELRGYPWHHDWPATLASPVFWICALSTVSETRLGRKNTKHNAQLDDAACQAFVLCTIFLNQRDDFFHRRISSHLFCSTRASPTADIMDGQCFFRRLAFPAGCICQFLQTALDNPETHQAKVAQLVTGAA